MGASRFATWHRVQGGAGRPAAKNAPRPRSRPVATAAIHTRETVDTLDELELWRGFRELDAREAEGIAVELLWQPQTGELVVTAYDARAGQAVAVPVGPTDARYVYRHPFAAAAIRGLL